MLNIVEDKTSIPCEILWKDEIKFIPAGIEKVHSVYYQFLENAIIRKQYDVKLVNEHVVQYMGKPD